MIWIFKTSVQNHQHVQQLKPLLNSCIGESWSFDLEDCDKILRIDSADLSMENLLELLDNEGFHCSELPD
ncbi:MAG: hypothetical protein EOP53_25110 [Sphingobacteriales bacterium]|nr:MAG: hypothetical protein EOP53_25110 [Sphingobacteriales bacterium]